MSKINIFGMGLVVLTLADPTYLEETDDGFVFKNVTPGTLAWELGFAENDVPLFVNGHSVRTFNEALTTLSVVQDATAITVRFERDDVTLSHDYVIR